MNVRARPVILVSEPLNDRTLAYLREHGEVRQADGQKNRAQVLEAVAEADGLVVRTYTQVDEELLAKARRLKVVGRAGVALENIDVPACKARGIEVVHTPEANTLAVVDYVTRMIVEMNRRFWPMTGPMTGEEFHKARKQIFGRFLAGAVLGIVGAGRIGSRVGRIAAAAGMTVLYNDIKDIRLDYPATAVDKPTLYGRSDIVTIHVPLTALTRKFINAETLAMFKPGAQFINAARGQCVDYPALAAAIRRGAISTAVIDCHDPEPPPADYPMYGLANVILTPHVAARVPAAVEAMCDVVYDVVAVLEGREPKFPAQPEAYGAEA
jgi:phosphoglycerate dehydrogenase-like enzyme